MIDLGGVAIDELQVKGIAIHNNNIDFFPPYRKFNKTKPWKVGYTIEVASPKSVLSHGLNSITPFY